MLVHIATMTCFILFIVNVIYSLACVFRENSGIHEDTAWFLWTKGASFYSGIVLGILTFALACLTNIVK